MKARVEIPVIEGWSDKPSARLSETVMLEWDTPAVPRVGDLIETGYGAHSVRTVSWSLDGSPVHIRLAFVYTGADSMEVAMAAMRDAADRLGEAMG